MKRKLMAGVLAASMCLSMAACTGNTEETTAATTTQGKPAETTTIGSSAETTTVNAPTETTTAAKPSETTTNKNTGAPIETSVSDDIEAVEVGKFITLRYNAASADVSWEIEKGVGSREKITFTIKLQDGYLFDGWSEGDAIVNGKKAVSKELTYTVNAMGAKTLFLNTSMQIVYHENGGSLLKGGTSDTFSAVFYQNPNTRPEKNYFSREGYTLTGYNTKADGTGESVSLGSKVTGGKGKIELYCIWEQNSPDADFATKADGAGVSITEYKGSSDTVVIPKSIGGRTVVGIENNAFAFSAVKRVVVASSVKKIEKNAFADCVELAELVLFDTVTSIADSAFASCDALMQVRLNTTTDLLNEWYSCAAAKIDRLMWAKDKKKIIIIGGSGSLYGFDSSVIEEALNGEYEIINFGENANISSIVYFDIAEDFVNEGDIVLWCPEPGVHTLGDPRCSSRFWEFRKSNYDFTKYINPQYYLNFYSSFASFAATLASKSFKDYDTLSANMSKYGDDMSQRSWSGDRYTYSFNYGVSGEDAIGELVGNITAKGASVYFSFAAMQESGMKSVSANTVQQFEDKITAIDGILSISDYTDCIFEDSAFWNSPWHLTDAGSAERAEQVAKDIKKALGKS